jgi:hypothetical protein
MAWHGWCRLRFRTRASWAQWQMIWRLWSLETFITLTRLYKRWFGARKPIDLNDDASTIVAAATTGNGTTPIGDATTKVTHGHPSQMG